MYTSNQNEAKQYIKKSLESSDGKSLGFRKLFELIYYLLQKSFNTECFAVLNEITTTDKIFSYLDSVKFPQFYSEFFDFPPYDLLYIVSIIFQQSQNVQPSTYLYTLFNFYLTFYESLLKCVNSQDIILNDEFNIESRKKTFDSACSTILSKLSIIASSISAIYLGKTDKMLFSKFVDNLLTTKSYLFHDSNFSCIIGRMLLSLNKYHQAHEIFSYISDIKILSSNQPYIDFFRMNFQSAANGFEQSKNPMNKMNQVVAYIYSGNIKQAVQLFNEKVKEFPALRLFNSVRDLSLFLHDLCSETEVIKEIQISNYPLLDEN
ncbi:hypothetical protein TVAG_349800 [Trichomonas vaginalis G3]|uniref:Uncharacterized protein n=1 Tax=Trichomonas vaginalis (strain ATCC PRA-98 / G3) TaxID=412133 RepID=A2FYB8_TRIV3|nr:hypothetical protein TVAGG3_0432460 [Trichomonas vaginalis G3]EAX90102.1 hypothetical protein TVAG_349800 [Trichomonas vaginalis G3]KAI5536851.1 hypothetical protein TVAGG3_0432460 [Trichomonas vaginalis G3]|eukprot:XP_001303032.1 hypothetical protein [Trichomonas vaginalis G3]